MSKLKFLSLLIVAAFGITACSNSDIESDSKQPQEKQSQLSADASVKLESEYSSPVLKPGSPFRISYKVIGTPIVGSPVTVNLRVTSSLGSQPLKISYRINDASAMMFHEAQPSEIKMAPAANEDFIAQQVTVIPQREGRLYLNVGASVETDSGSMSSMMAIPIQVGSGGRELQENGELQLDENGEAVRVLTVE